MSFLLLTGTVNGADRITPFMAGLSAGTGKQPFFPFKSPDYSYRVNSCSAVLNWLIKKKKSLSFEFQAEAGFHYARHKMLNEYFIQPGSGYDYLELRKKFMAEKTIHEYTLNLGLQVRYTIKQNFSLFSLASIGPMISDKETERLAAGFAFADLLAVGAAYDKGRLRFELRSGLRHVSNANLKKPNSGHNAAVVDLGFTFRFRQ